MMRNLFHSVCGRLGFEVRMKRTLRRNKERASLEKWCATWDPLVRRHGIRTMLDIGAHTGSFAAMLRQNNPNLHLVCFEPLGPSFAALHSTCAKLGNARCHQLALGSEEGEVEMNASEFSPSSSLLPMLPLHREEWPASAGSRREKVRLCRLDDVAGLDQAPDPIGIKIDVQGFEDRVIGGGRRTLSRAAFVVIETSFYPLYKDQPLFASVYDLMKALGFVYHGAISTSHSRSDGRILQEDSLFLPGQGAVGGEGT